MFNYCSVFGSFLLFFGLVFLVFSLVLFVGGGYYVNWELFEVHGCEVGATVVLDWVSLLFLSFVLLISSSVMYYREGYMLGDSGVDRFCFGVFLFVLSIVFVILSPNLIRILLG